MAKVTFDTLKFVSKLTHAGLPEPIAIAFSDAQNEILVEAMDNTIATKADFFELKQEIQNVEMRLERSITALDYKIDRAIDKLNLKIDTKIDQLDAKSQMQLETSISSLKTNITLLNWMMGILITSHITLLLRSFFG